VCPCGAAPQRKQRGQHSERTVESRAPNSVRTTTVS
jgi:hypothetical protein